MRKDQNSNKSKNKIKNEIEQHIFKKMKSKDFGESMCNKTKLNVLKWTMQQLYKNALLIKPVVMDSALKVTAGTTCPKCNIDGLFKIQNGYRCEECLSHFDENKILISD